MWIPPGPLFVVHSARNSYEENFSVQPKGSASASLGSPSLLFCRWCGLACIIEPWSPALAGRIRSLVRSSRVECCHGSQLERGTLFISGVRIEKWQLRRQTGTAPAVLQILNLQILNGWDKLDSPLEVGWAHSFIEATDVCIIRLVAFWLDRHRRSSAIYATKLWMQPCGVWCNLQAARLSMYEPFSMSLILSVFFFVVFWRLNYTTVSHTVCFLCLYLLEYYACRTADISIYFYNRTYDCTKIVRNSRYMLKKSLWICCSFISFFRAVACAYMHD